ncbi:LamG-like jellyroll fold domain-containing protein [Pedobacter montanisoli]|uniref:T9SS type A sorting domain-containing protein n=1 Tax=Pedobacter montanisoli TaxID=2923277 RepID=A0ABS9ZYI2_9SPHI|nr:LamG-like jellyroll fold domain-containing protein [Pedobacter montanisoli]MCJ0743347.1 T9SS type A sorting domain-containing protein [Pedobacter montanisoli]
MKINFYFKLLFFIIPFLNITTVFAQAALNFNGTGYLSKGTVISTTATNFTMEAWVRWSGSGSNQAIIYNGSTGGNGYGIYLMGNSEIKVLMGGVTFVGSGVSLVPNEWTHLAIARNNNSITLYKNGISIANSTAAPYNPNGNFTIGANNAGSELFNGDIDEVRFWTTARSQEQIRLSMNVLQPSQTNLLAYYDFNNGTPNANNTTISTIPDISGNNNTLTLKNFALTGSSANFVQNVAKIYYVNAAATSLNIGTTWEDAYTNLQTAIDIAAPGDEVWVASGTYQPAYGASFIMKESVKIYGGFPATGNPKFTERNYKANVTTLRGNAGRVIRNESNGLTLAAVLDGFTITEGIVTYSSSGQDQWLEAGAGMRNVNVSPTVRNCTFTNNKAGGNGGAVYNEGGAPMFANCIFSANVCGYTTAGTRSGGAMANNNSTPNLTDCTFSSNIDRCYGGGALFNSYCGAMMLTRCTFLDNSSTSGGAVRNRASHPAFNNCLFLNNKADRFAGAFWNEDILVASPTFTNCVFANNISTGDGAGGAIYNEAAGVSTFNNCVFYGNKALSSGSGGGDGGAFYSSYGATQKFINCTFTRNSSVYHPEVIVCLSSTTEFRNTVLFGNTGGVKSEASFTKGGSVLYIYNSLIQSYPPDDRLSGWYLYAANNLDNTTDPLFVNADNPAGNDGIWGTADDGLRLQVQSPLINKGDNSMATVAIDMVGNQRQVGTVDIGAYEYQGFADPTLSSFADMTKTYGDAPFTIIAPTSNSPGAFSYTSSNTAVATINGSTITIVGAGTAIITAKQAATANYSEGNITKTLTVNKGNPVFSGFANMAKTYGDAPFTIIEPTSNSTGAFSYTSSNTAVATINASTVTIVGAGTATITATQAATANYGGGSTTITLTIARKAITITAANKTKVYDGQVFSGPYTIASYTGFVNGEDETTPGVFSGTLSYNGTAKTAVNVGTAYTIVPSGLTAANYTINYVNGELTITKTTVTGLTLKDDNVAYDGTPKTLAVTGNLPTGVTVNYDSYTAVGTYQVTATISGANYQTLILTATLKIINPVPGNNNIIYVNLNATGTGTGTTWTNAMPQLAEALKWARQQNNFTADNPLKIYVAQGTYKPLYSGADGSYTTKSNSRDNAFVMVNNVKLYGGFTGNETNLNGTANDLAGRVLPNLGGTGGTILSGDIGTVNDSSDNSYHVMVIASAAADSIVVDGFAFAGANGDKSTTYTCNGINITANTGGGLALYNTNNKVLIRNCAFTDNQSNQGAGLYTLLASPVLQNCVIQGNTAMDNGGAMSNFNASAPTCINVLMTGNKAAYGGAVFAGSSSNPKFINCTVAGNYASGDGGGINTKGNTAITTIGNSIVYGNATGGVSPNIRNEAGGMANVLYSLIESSTGIWQSSFGTDQGNNVFANPYFVQAVIPTLANTPNNTGDYSLKDISNVINKGSNNLLPVSITIDLANAVRIWQNRVDLGAYEFQGISTPTLSNFPDVTKTYGDAVFALTGPDSNSDGAISYSSSNTNVATVNGNTVNITGAGTATITATQAAMSGYNSGSITMTLTVNQRPISIQPAFAQKTYGSTYSYGTMASAVTISGQGIASGQTLSAVTITSSGTPSIAPVIATPYYTSKITNGSVVIKDAGDNDVTTNYVVTLQEGQLQVEQAVLTVTAADQAKVYDGQKFAGPYTIASYQGFVNGEHENTFGVLQGALSYGGSAQTAVNASATVYPIIPSGLTAQNYTINYVNGGLTITKRQITITAKDVTKTYATQYTFANNSSEVIITGTRNPVFASGDGISTLLLSSTGAATGADVTTYPIVIDNNSIIIKDNNGSGNEVTANYAVSLVNGEMTVNKANPSLSGFADINKIYGDAVFTLTAPTSSSSETFSYSSNDANVASINGSTVTIKGAGTATITATQAATTNYNSASINLTLSVGKANQTISFAPLTTKTTTSPDFALLATVSSNLALNFTSSNAAVAEVYQDAGVWKVHIKGEGTTDITASQTGSSNYLAAADVTQQLQVIGAPLPVTLISFMAKPEGRYAKLEWKTASEQNNRGFEIYRSGDDGFFVKIGEVSASPLSNLTSHSYAYIDKTPLNGTNYYKLVQIDNDGKPTELGIRSLTFSFSAYGFLLYPNPAEDQVNISFTAGRFNLLQVVDINGKVLQQWNINDREDSKILSLGRYPIGTYIIRLRGKGINETQKVVKK